MAKRYSKKRRSSGYAKPKRVRRVASRGRSGMRGQTIRIELVQPRASGLPADPAMIGLKRTPALQRSRF